jgi:hypothetical protein
LIGLSELGQFTRATPVDPEETDVDTEGVQPVLVDGLR